LAIDHLAFHREQADLAFQRVPFLDHAARHHLEIPDDVAQIEGDLLFGLISHQVGDLLHLDGRWLEKSRQTGLPRHAHANLVAAGVIAFAKLGQRFGDQFTRVRLGLAKQFRIFDVVECVRYNLGPLSVTAQRFDRCLPDFDAPDTAAARHENAELVDKKARDKRLHVGAIAAHFLTTRELVLADRETVRWRKRQEDPGNLLFPRLPDISHPFG